MAQDHIPMVFGEDPEGTRVDLHRDLTRLFNRHSVDVSLNTPDHVLATMVISNLDAYSVAVNDTNQLKKDGPFDAAMRALTSLDRMDIPDVKSEQTRCGVLNSPLCSDIAPPPFSDCCQGPGASLASDTPYYPENIQP